jgi:tetratricopeptide (TPR) repeat protein
MLAQEADQIITLQPNAPDGYLLRGVAEIDRKNYAVADDYLKRSIEKEAINPSAYVQLGNLRAAQNQLPDAQKAYQQALEQDPNSADALGGVLNVYLKQQQPDKAFATLKAQVAKYPNNSAFHSMLGSLQQGQYKDLAAAESEYKRAVELDKNNTTALASLGMVQNERGNIDAALQTYLDAAKSNPNDIRFPVLAGGLYEKKKDWDSAKQMYQKALAVRPDDPLASNNLAYVMLQQGGNVEVAFQMAQTARRLLPNNPNTADTLGWAFYQRHVYTSAINLLKEAVKQEPDNALFNYHLGLAYAKGGQAAPARQQLERVKRLKPNSPEVDELQRTLAESKS